MRFLRNEKGFTLIELMVVILIIGILVAIAVPIFNQARASAWQRTCQANLRTMDGALQTWAADNPGTNYPQTQAAVLDANSTLIPNYIKAEPHCPMNASNRYNVSANPLVTMPPTISCPNDPATHKYP